MRSTPDGGGYWEASADGGLFAAGNAPYLGSMVGQVLNNPIAAIAASPDGAGYRLVGSDGGTFTFGNSEFEGSTGGQTLSAPIVGIAG
jgi:hypothetical protein